MEKMSCYLPFINANNNISLYSHEVIYDLLVTPVIYQLRQLNYLCTSFFIY